MNGLATGFILSQTSVVLATLTGIWFLGQNSQGNDRNDYRLSFDFGSSYDHSDDLKSIQRPIIQGVEYFILKIMQQLWKEPYFAPN